MAKYWLMKSEPSSFSIDDLRNRPGTTDYWDGVRNYQARNMLRDEMQPGDLAFFYHSSCATPAIVGTLEIISVGYPDHTAFDPEHHHYDPDSSPDEPRWYMVDVRLKKKFKYPITLTALKHHPDLSGLKLLQRGNRLSVMPVSQDEWRYILALAK